MTSKGKLLSLALLSCVFIFGGCDWLGQNKKPGGEEIGKTPAEQRKAKLLKQIDRKFENPEAHFELGQICQAERRWAEAEHHYNLALNFDPVYREAQAARVKVLPELGEKSKADLLADIYIEQASNSALGSLKLGLGFQKQQLDHYAVKCYQQALHLAPNSAKIHRQMGYYYLSKNETQLAGQYLRRSYDLDRNQPDVAYQLGLLGVRIERRPKIEKDMKKLDKAVEESGT